MRALARRRDHTIVFATHYLAEAADYADRIIIIDRGRVAADGTSAQLRQLDPLTTLTATWPARSSTRSTTPGGSTHPTQPRGDDDAAHQALTTLLAPLGQAVACLSVHGGKVRVRTSASDDVARLLLTSSPVRDLAITPPTLDEIFTRLVGGHTSEETA